jgi:hypothetical protein
LIGLLHHYNQAMTNPTLNVRSSGPLDSQTDTQSLAAAWFSRLLAAPHALVPHSEPVPQDPLATLAAFAMLTLSEDRTLLILVPDDDALPGIANKLSPEMRPLCLVLPRMDFVAQTALRATLSMLKSRLSRYGEAAAIAPPAWLRQRNRIAAHADLWQASQDWADDNNRMPIPLAITELFPVRILPISAYRQLQHKTADITLLYACDAPPELISPAGHILKVGMPAQKPQHALAIDSQRLRLIQEKQLLIENITALESELITVQTEVTEFTHHYHQQVGQRMAKLEALQASLARKNSPHAAQPSAARTEKPAQPPHEKQARDERQADFSSFESHRATGQKANEAANPQKKTAPAQDIKRRFRQLAQQIHPDRATSDADRAWRTQLMSQANHAYSQNDARALSDVATLWETRKDHPSPMAANGNIRPADTTYPDADLAAEVSGLRAYLARIERNLQQIFSTRLYDLFMTARQAARQGRDLLREMAEQLDESIRKLQERAHATT